MESLMGAGCRRWPGVGGVNGATGWMPFEQPPDPRMRGRSAPDNPSVSQGVWMPPQSIGFQMTFC